MQQRAVGTDLGGRDDVVDGRHLALAEANASLFDEPARGALRRGEARFGHHVHDLQARGDAGGVEDRGRQIPRGAAGAGGASSERRAGLGIGRGRDVGAVHDGGHRAREQALAVPQLRALD